jgi:heme/copper-type cytochrome/quinol oxidase subunit 2
MCIIVSTLVKQHVPPVEQELPVVEHLAHLGFCAIWTIVCHFVLFIFVIVLFVHLRFTAGGPGGSVS